VSIKVLSWSLKCQLIRELWSSIISSIHCYWIKSKNIKLILLPTLVIQFHLCNTLLSLIIHLACSFYIKRHFVKSIKNMTPDLWHKLLIYSFSHRQIIFSPVLSFMIYHLNILISATLMFKLYDILVLAFFPDTDEYLISLLSYMRNLELLLQMLIVHIPGNSPFYNFSSSTISYRCIGNTAYISWIYRIYLNHGKLTPHNLV